MNRDYVCPNRLAILRLCQTDNRERTAQQLALEIGTYPESVRGRLMQMRVAGEMTRRRRRHWGRAQWFWRATRKGLAVDIGALTILPRVERLLWDSAYDHRALSSALGIPATAPGLRGERVTVHRMEAA